MTLGWGMGILTGAIDVLKATLVVYLFSNLYPSSAPYPMLPFLAGAMTVIGHNYPFYMKFNGGKGTASAIGIILGYDFYMGLVIIAVIIASTVITNFLVVGTVNIYLVMICLAVFKYQSVELIVLSVLLGILGVYKHRMNFVRIKNGTEPTFRGTL